MTEQYRQICVQCDIWGKELGIPAIGEIVHAAEALLERDQPVLTFVDLSGLPGGLGDIAAYLCGKDVLREHIGILRKWDDWSVRLQYGTSDEWYMEEIQSRSLVVVTPAEILKGKEVVLLCAGNHGRAYTREVAASGLLYLLTDAAMAMTKAQVDWVRDYLQHYCDFERFQICLMGTEHLALEEQHRQVVEYIYECMKPYGKASLLQTRDEITDSIAFADRNIMQLTEASRRCTMRNMLTEISQVMGNLAARSKVQEEDFIHVSRQLDGQRERLISAGKIAAGNILDNRVKKIMRAVEDSAEEYGDSMRDNIIEVIHTAKDIEDVEPRIRPYMERAWSYFTEQTSAQIAKDFDQINAELTRRMEEDISGMLQQLDMPARQMLGQFAVEETGNCLPDSFCLQADDKVLKTVSRNVRNMMILTIPLLFVSPTLSAAAILGGGIYSRIEKKQEREKYRQDLSSHVETVCYEARKNAVGSFRQTLEQEQVRMKELVQEGYRRLVDLLQEELEQQQKAVMESGAKTARIEEILGRELPEMQRNL